MMAHTFSPLTFLPLRCEECGRTKSDPIHDPILIKNTPPAVQFTAKDEVFLRAIELMPLHLTRPREE